MSGTSRLSQVDLGQGNCSMGEAQGEIEITMREQAENTVMLASPNMSLRCQCSLCLFGVALLAAHTSHMHNDWSIEHARAYNNRLPRCRRHSSDFILTPDVETMVSTSHPKCPRISILKCCSLLQFESTARNPYGNLGPLNAPRCKC